MSCSLHPNGGAFGCLGCEAPDALVAEASEALLRNLSYVPPAEVCANCKFFDGQPHRVEVKEASHSSNYTVDGSCRINPPAMRDQGAPQWPGVMNDDFCGHFKLRVVP